MIDKLYTLQETAKLLGVSRITLYQWEKKGLITFIRLSSHATRISESELNRFLKERQDVRF